MLGAFVRLKTSVRLEVVNAPINEVDAHTHVVVNVDLVLCVQFYAAELVLSHLLGVHSVFE